MTKPVAMNICPSEETLAAFIDGRLDPEARQRVIEHIVECAECRDIVMTAHEFQADEADEGITPPARIVSRFSPRATFIASAVLAAAAVLIVVFGPMMRERWGERGGGMQALVEASESLRHRTLEARLSGPFPYRPLRPTLRSKRDKAPEADSIELAATVARIREDAAAGRQNKHVEGVGELLVGDIEQAVSQLESALRMATATPQVAAAIKRSADAALLIDLSAAYYARAVRDGDADDFALSLEAAERSWNLSRSPAAAWNRALATEALMPDEAEDAWRDYLDIDSTSGYADEARAKIELGRDSGLGRSPSFETEKSLFNVRLKIEDILIPAWADHVIDNRILEAAACLQDISKLSQAHHDATGEQYYLEISRHLAAAGATGSAKQTARAIREYAVARHLYRDRDYDDAMRSFDRAGVGLAQQNSPLALMARVWSAAAAFSQNELSRSVEFASAVRSDLSRQPRWFVAEAYACWIQSLGALSQGQADTARQARERARELFVQLGEPENVAAMDSLLAECYEHIGDTREAWQHRSFALRFASANPANPRQYAIMDEAASSALRHGRVAAALLFQRRLLRDSHERNDVVALGDAHRWRASACIETSDNACVEREIAFGRSVLAEIETLETERRLDADLNLVEARWLAPTGSVKAESLARSAFDFYLRTGRHGRLSEAAVVLSRELTERGALNDAKTVLTRAIEIVEAARRGVADVRNRATYLGNNRDAYLELAALQTKQGAYDEAFDAIEYARARSYLEALDTGDTATGPLKIEQIIDRLRPGHVLLVFASIDGDYHAWVLSATQNQHWRIAQVTDVARQVIALDDTNSKSRSLAALTDLLIAPVWPSIKSAEGLIVVSDTLLDGVPLSALRVPDGRMLVQCFAIASAPSCSIAILLSTRDCRTAPENVTIIAQSGGSGVVLGAAMREARFVASRFRNSVLLIGATLEIRDLQGTLPNADLVHIIAHGSAATKYAFFASFGMLSNAVALRSGEWLGLGLKFGPCTTVLLVGCETGLSGSGSADAPTSVAHAMLAAGAHRVIATTSAVPDVAADGFTRRYYAALRRSGETGQALRDAQMTYIGSADYVWSAFQLFGAL